VRAARSVCRSAPSQLLTTRAVLPWDVPDVPLVGRALEFGSGCRTMEAPILTQHPGLTLTATAVDVGMVRINGETAGVEPQAPFGGMKASSSHSREQGRAALEFFTAVKTVAVGPAGG